MSIKGDKKVKNLKFDLDEGNTVDNIVITEDIPDLDGLKTSTEDSKKFDDYMLPVKTADSDGNLIYSMKLLDNVTVDEFKSWMNDVLPLGDELIERFMGLGAKKDKNNFSNIKVRREIFNAVIKMHEMRWVFGLGKDKLPKDLASN